jgi:hypothetical protein
VAALGHKNSGPSIHNKDAAAPVPDCHIPAIRREFRRILFCKTRAGPPVAVQSTNSNADNSGQIHRKSRDFSRAISRCMRSQPAGTEKDVFVAPPPAIRATRASKLGAKTKPGSCGRALHL